MRGKSRVERTEVQPVEATCAMALPRRCAASLGWSELKFNLWRLLAQWLCHADARQVFDLPCAGPLNLAVYDRLQTILSMSTVKGSTSFGDLFQKRALDQ